MSDMPLKRGIFRVTMDGPFKADIDITRGELAVILSKYGSFDGDGICTEFSDVPNDYYATGYIKVIV